MRIYPSRLIKVLTIVLFLITLNNHKVIASDKKEENIIIKICRSSMHKEMNDAGKKPPPGMIDSTCNCFFNKVYLGSSINYAQEKCKEEAADKYKLENL